MGLCGSAPSAPDPVVTANAQGTVNKDTAITQANLNRIDQVSPYGSSTYSIKGYNSDGTPQYVQTNSLSPQLQAMLDSQLQQDQSLTGLGSTLIDQAKTNSGTPLTASGTMPLIGGMSPDQFNNWTNAFKTTAGPIALGNTATAGPSAQYGGAGASAGSANASQASGWDIQKALQGAGDLQGQFNSARDAALQSQMGYLQPQFDQQSQQAADQLRQQGITQQSNPAAYQHGYREKAVVPFLITNQAENNKAALGWYHKRNFYRLDAAIFLAQKVPVEPELLRGRAGEARNAPRVAEGPRDVGVETARGEAVERVEVSRPVDERAGVEADQS